MREEARLWWNQSKRDKRTAVHAHESKDHYAAVFWIHQSVEKALKAVVIEKTRSLAPRTHNLLELAALAGLPPGHLSFLRELSPHFIITRYPDAAGAEPADMYDGRASRAIIRKSEGVLRWAGKHL